MPDWRVELLRLTVFLGQEVRPPVRWWTDITGQEPATQTVQQGLGFQQLGPLRDNYCQLSLEGRGMRVDWLMSPQPLPRPPEQAPDGFPSFDTLPGGLAVFRELLLPWVGRMEDVQRVAFGAVLSFPVEDKVAGYRALQPLLPALQIDPIDSSDLVYQINRHAPSRALDGLHVNRLSTWTVVQFKVMTFQIQAAGIPATIGAGVPDSHAVRLQLDVNTDAARSEPLPSGTIVPTTEELIAFGQQIADRGDRR